MQFEEIWPRGFRGEVVQRCEQTDGRTDDWRGVIKTAHLELKNKNNKNKNVDFTVNTDKWLPAPLL